VRSARPLFRQAGLQYSSGEPVKHVLAGKTGAETAMNGRRGLWDGKLQAPIGGSEALGGHFLAKRPNLWFSFSEISARANGRSSRALSGRGDFRLLSRIDEGLGSLKSAITH
jgi:hypothetical protein